MSHDNVYQARLTPPAGTGHPDGDGDSHWWEIDVLGVGVTQAERLEDCTGMAAELVAIMFEDVPRDSIRIEFVQ